MVGAKEFAINRKVIQVKNKNPVIESIILPKSMRSHETEMKKMTGSFLDRMMDKDKSKEDHHYAPRMAKAFDARTINPILEDSRKSNHNESSFRRAPFLSSAKKISKHEEHEEEEEKDISDELANRITYKVFQNIKSYLNGNMGQSSAGKHIKLEISL
ncbi:hypothetical protein UFOVP51_53 [uncultured Caudovirales phage]|uniref:Uncharacterized protein n=1 Tax=uncultured Caudovirales phage TaxID=2100421 RepID=A0A6J5TBV7_9CAUD|nr:hypothetical protein UFOVP51_53 [uncultured Caudovirales phage]CAB4240978.1 hypothetical protein UFOVP34_53 [uncultured Caudovirales phage]